jgi:hypothetical protein
VSFSIQVRLYVTQISILRVFTTEVKCRILGSDEEKILQPLIRNSTMEKLVASEKEGCVALGISRPTFRKLGESGMIPVCRIGRRVMYPVAGLEAFVLAGGTTCMGRTHRKTLDANK